MFNQIFILDLKGKVLIARNYRGEIDNNIIDKFMGLLLEKGKYIVKLMNFIIVVNSISYYRGRRKFKSNFTSSGMYFCLHKDQQFIYSLYHEKKCQHCAYIHYAP